MIESNLFEIKKYDFNQNLLAEICENNFVNGLWPLVYILSDGLIKEAYVGETTDALSRMSNHLKSNSKKKLTAVRLITSDKFNKSATLDIEANLIKYLSGDGQYKLLNGNIGLANDKAFRC
jgi:predicted GIY-YIG superfamily endonuclease